MPLSKPQQQLRRYLKESAVLLKWSGVDLMQSAMRMPKADQEHEAKELLNIAASYQAAEDKLVGHVEEVKAGLISRTAESRN